MIALGIDSGTQSTKTIALDLDTGEILGAASQGLRSDREGCLRVISSKIPRPGSTPSMRRCGIVSPSSASASRRSWPWG